MSAAGSTEYSSAIAEAISLGNPELAGNIFSAENADKHGPGCAKLTAAMLPYVSTTFFAKITRGCFKNIPPAAFSGLSDHQFKAIPPELLREITGAQASKIPTAAFFGMTADQIEDWGPPYVPPKEDEGSVSKNRLSPGKKSKKGKKGKGKKDKDVEEDKPVVRKSDDTASIDHPCVEARRMLTAVKPPLRRRLRTRCKVTENSAMATSPTLVTAALGAMFFALVL